MIYYFGCWESTGHRIWRAGWISQRNFELERENFPLGHHLDCTPMFLPIKEISGNGVLTYLPAPDITILAWWNNDFDSRGKTNSTVMVKGRISFNELWTLFKEKFPDPKDSIKKPNLINERV